MQAGSQAIGELYLGYGAYGQDPNNLNVQGPALALNLSAYNHFQAGFSRSNLDLNLVVGFYTTVPHLNANGDPLSYWSGEITAAPTVPGGPAARLRAICCSSAATPHISTSRMSTASSSS